MLLTHAGYIEYVDEITTRSRVMITADRRDLYDLRLDSTTENVLQLLLRTYTGLFADYVNIDEARMAYRLDITESDVYDALLLLGRMHILHYVPRKSMPYIIYTTSRELPKHVNLPKAVYEDMRDRMQHRIESMKHFVFDTSECRVAGMLRYFGERDATDCDKCDVCRNRRKKNAPSTDEEARIRRGIAYLASQPEGHTVDYIASQLGVRRERIVETVRVLADAGIVRIDASGTVSI